jgi:hypothetical protein
MVFNRLQTSAAISAIDSGPTFTLPPLRTFAGFGDHLQIQLGLIAWQFFVVLDQQVAVAVDHRERVFQVVGDGMGKSV